LYEAERRFVQHCLDSHKETILIAVMNRMGSCSWNPGDLLVTFEGTWAAWLSGGFRPEQGLAEVALMFLPRCRTITK
jgi:hypothetical protein